MRFPAKSDLARIRRVARQNWDELGISAALGHLAATQQTGAVNPELDFVVEAIRRSRADLHGADLEQVRAYVSSLDEDQIPGLVNNLKGIAHEVYFVEAENRYGDAVYAYLFRDTNHPDFDVILHDGETGRYTELQLKASDAPTYVDQAVEELGAEQVVVTSELAERMGLHSSGISDERLTADVEQVVDQLTEDESLWDYVPALTTWSIALVIASLARRYARGEISRKRFLRMVAVFAGAKAVKVAVIVSALSVPGLNVVTGALLFLKLASSVRQVYAEGAHG